MELISILAAGAYCFIAASVQHLFTVYGRGLGFVMSDRADPLPASGFTGRSTRALSNSVESAAMFVPAALVVQIAAGQTAVTAAAATVYVVARAVFLLAYWGGINKVRSLSWGIGMASIIVTYAAAIRAVLA
ncbi:MAPEG family protein [Shimia biformata]|uniref:MAPEG family protein n=1 Tax=Shimia biformata TaxID=1294299 RepID=UPI0019508C02|nr:MAPEG family protein [Shimia biformata]